MLSQGAADRAALTKKFNQLYQERKDLISNIKSISRRHKLISDNLKQQAHVGQSPKKKADPQFQKSIEHLDHHQHLNTKEQDIKQAVATQDSIRDRNKRLFGGLNVHLKKAEKKLREEEQKAKEKMTIEEMAAKKERENTTKLQQERLKQLQEQLAKLTAKREAVQEALLQTENSILKSKFVAFVSDQEHYLTTHTQPPLPWQPVHFSPQLSSLLHDNKQQRKVELERVTEQIMNYNEKFDYFTYNIQNQKEYYNNLLDAYLSSRSTFILTKTRPQLFWSPVPEVKLGEAVGETGNMLVEEGALRKEEAEQYYMRFSRSGEIEQVVGQNDSESH